ncbi:apolipoprotein A-I-like [Sphaeramia orbicularis]|uniref:Apolipoprotein A-I-like n=1 Tax=Sphaeramia orbicularis TaxID=375764 RepID=A0A672ZD68_9TELE|nr:apolipoprotein A-I-like [Sphaeramia orbicularis]
MKFVALALALLLAVGSQAASLQSDPLVALQNARAVAQVHINNAKEGIHRVIGHLDGTEYADIKATLTAAVDNMFNNLQSFQQSAAPMTDSVVSTIADATAEMRAGIEKDIEDLKETIQANRLREILESHINDYQTMLMPLMQELQARRQAEMEAMSDKIQEARNSLREKFNTNLEETKNALLPVIDQLKEKLGKHVEMVKTQAGPYVNEYAEQMQAAVNQARGVSAADVTALREKIMPLGEEIMAKLREIAQTVVASVNQS